MEVSDTELKSFYEHLQEELKDYSEEFEDIIKYAPEMFRLFTNLLSDPDVRFESKRIIKAVLAYFISPNDAIPEGRIGSWGYLDDLFLCAWSLKKLEHDLGYGILTKNWRGDDELKVVVDAIYETGRAWLEGMEETIIHEAGLSKKDFRGIK
jgi:uncharacterized membrane protein YkvA (DUF1232 family)